MFIQATDYRDENIKHVMGNTLLESDLSKYFTYRLLSELSNLFIELIGHSYNYRNLLNHLSESNGERKIYCTIISDSCYFNFLRMMDLHVLYGDDMFISSVGECGKPQKFIT